MDGQTKALLPLGGETVIQRLLRSVRKTDIDPKPIIVVSQDSEIPGVLGSGYDYVIQKESRGTGHAAHCAKEAAGDAEAVIVVYGDMPFIQSSTLRVLRLTQIQDEPTLTMATIKVPDFEGDRASLASFGRIIRKGGQVAKIVEVKDASDEELEITEVNPSFFCFNASWLWRTLPKVGTKNAQGEYYLTDTVGIAVAEKALIATVPADPIEAVGINTPAELEIAQRLAKQ